MKLPNKKIALSQLERNLQSPTTLECVPASITKIFVDMDNGGSIVFLNVEGKQLGFPVKNVPETSMLVFMRSGCGAHPHIRSVYHLWLAAMQGFGIQLKRAVIEAKHGDVYYARLEWEAKDHTPIFNVCSGGDALVMCETSGAPLQIVRKVLDDLESFDWPYREEIFDGG